ncbi:hypothetical protein ACLOJK_010877 [Asimina triloba]
MQLVEFFPVCILYQFVCSQMAQEPINPEEVVLAEEVNQVRLITLNRPRQLNVISSKVVKLLAQFLEKWEKDDNAELLIIKGAGRAFSAGGDLKMFYDGRSGSSKAFNVAMVHGIVMGGGAALSAPLKFSVVTEKTVFAVPEAREYFALTGARLSGKELIAVGLATHFVPSEKLADLEKRLIALNSGDEHAVRSVIEEFSVDVQLEEDSILNKQSTINECFDKESVEEIVKSFETEAAKEGNGWINAVLKGLKRSSPTGLKITLRSIREGRKQNLPECLKKEFRLTMNILRSVISGDVYEGIRAMTIDKDNSPKWDPPVLEKVSNEKIDTVFQPFKQELELQIPAEGEACRSSTMGESSSLTGFSKVSILALVSSSTLNCKVVMEFNLRIEIMKSQKDRETGRWPGPNGKGTSSTIDSFTTLFYSPCDHHNKKRKDAT